jgi:hypothetical protein
MSVHTKAWLPARITWPPGTLTDHLGVAGRAPPVGSEAPLNVSAAVTAM